MDQGTEEDTIEKILRYGGSAIAGTGNLLDYLGGAVRGGLGDLTDLYQGNEYEGHTLDSLLSDPTSSEYRVSGRDLAEQWGLAGENSMSWIPDAGDALGFGVEVATDPLTYATFGAATAAGKAAQMAGKGAKTFGGAVRAGERSLLGLGNPFSQDVAVNLLGQGTVGEKIADGLSTVADAARYGNIPGTSISPGQRLASLFSPFDARTGEVGKAIRDEGLADELLNQEMEGRTPYTRMSQELLDLGVPMEELESASKYGRGLLERQKLWNAEETTSGMGVWLPWEQAGSQLSPKTKALVEQQATGIEGLMAADRQARRAAGLEVADPNTPAFTRYTPRQFVDMPGQNFDVARQEHFENLPGGTVFAGEQIKTAPKKMSDKRLAEHFPQVREDANFGFVNDLMNDQFMTGQGPLMGPPVSAEFLAKDLMGRRGQQVQDIYDAYQKAMVVNPNKVDPNLEAAGQIAESILNEYTGPSGRLGSELYTELGQGAKSARIPTFDAGALPPQIKERLRKFQSNVQTKYTADQKAAGGFARHLLADLEQGDLASRYEVATAKFAQKMLGRMADIPGATVSGDVTSVGDALKRLGYIGDDNGGVAFLREVNKHRRQGLRIRDDLTGQVVDAPMAGLVVKTAVVDDLARMFSKNSPEQTASVITAAFDGFTNLFKAYTLNWPGRWARDLTEGQTMNAVAGHSSVNAVQDSLGMLFQAKPLGNWQDYAQNTHIQKLLRDRGLNPDQGGVTKVVQELIRTTDLLSMRQGIYGTGHLTGSVAGVTPGRSEDFFSEMIGNKPVTAQSLKGSGRTWNPLAVRGGIRRLRNTELYPRTENYLMAGGEKIGALVDETNRLVPFLDMLRDGYDPLEARKVVDALQVNYRPNSFSKFERDYMKRLFPFYSFARKMTPQVIKMLGEKPGGAMGMMLRGARLQEEGAYEDENQYIDPDYGPALPLGDQTVVQGFGNPTDVINQYLPAKHEGVEGALLNLVAQLRPEVKVPLEMAFDKHAFFNTSFDEGYGGSPIPGATSFNAVAQSFVPRYSQLLKAKTLERPVETATKALLGLRLQDTTEDAVSERERSFQKLQKNFLKENPEFREMDMVVPKHGASTDVPDELETIFRTGLTVSKRASKERKRLKELQLP